MDMRKFGRLNKARCESPKGFNHSLNSWSSSDWFTAMVGEAGEAANLIKKLNRIRDGVRNKETEPQLRKALKAELADTFIYLDLLCQSLDIDLSHAVIVTFNTKSKDIGYPIQLGLDGDVE